MHRTASVGTLLHLLFCAFIVAVSFVRAVDDSTDAQADYNRFESKYFGENDTYNSDKRLIIEDFYRQTSLAAKSIQEMSFRLNLSGAAKLSEHEATKTFTAQTTSPHGEGKSWAESSLKLYVIVKRNCFSLFIATVEQHWGWGWIENFFEVMLWDQHPKKGWNTSVTFLANPFSPVLWA